MRDKMVTVELSWAYEENLRLLLSRELKDDLRVVDGRRAEMRATILEMSGGLTGPGMRNSEGLRYAQRKTIEGEPSFGYCFDREIPDFRKGSKALVLQQRLD